MIAAVKRPKSHRTTSARHAEFLAMLPAIRHSAQIAFRSLPGTPSRLDRRGRREFLCRLRPTG